MKNQHPNSYREHASTVWYVGGVAGRGEFRIAAKTVIFFRSKIYLYNKSGDRVAILKWGELSRFNFLANRVLHRPVKTYTLTTHTLFNNLNTQNLEHVRTMICIKK